MAHIELNNPMPGIVGLMHFRPQTAKPLTDLVETLLRGPSSLTSGEREMIAAYVSSKNDCHFCQTSHSAAAAAHLGGNLDLVEQVKSDKDSAPISDKLKALLTIAGMTQQGGKNVTEQHIAAAKAAGATDVEIHDTVLIAAAFCMYNRYVDGLATWAPAEKEAYVEMGKKMAFEGYSIAAQ
jgi:uncharacterized peroxidase-related enzyme